MLDADVDWLRLNNGAAGTLGYAIPGYFAVYGAMNLPDEIAATEDRLLDALAPESGEELIAGWIDRGPWPPPAGDEHVIYWDWKYRLRRVQSSDLRGLPGEGERCFPDLLFPINRSWLVSMLWDDSWRSIGATRAVARRIEQSLLPFEQLSAHTSLATTGRSPN